jgi:hypothetical protein
MALSRRNGQGDRNRAIEILNGVVADHGESPETMGILGRCFKSRWQEKEKSGDPGADDALDEAINAYDRGLEADPRDYYPGVNLITLLLRRGSPKDFARVKQIAPVVSFAVARKGGLRSRDYWTIATVLELSAVQGDEELGRRALSTLLDTQPDSWMLRTTADNLEILVEALPQLGQTTEWVINVAEALRGRA